MTDDSKILVPVIGVDGLYFYEYRDGVLYPINWDYLSEGQYHVSITRKEELCVLKEFI